MDNELMFRVYERGQFVTNWDSLILGGVIISCINY